MPPPNDLIVNDFLTENARLAYAPGVCVLKQGFMPLGYIQGMIYNHVSAGVGGAQKSKSFPLCLRKA